MKVYRGNEVAWVTSQEDFNKAVSQSEFELMRDFRQKEKKEVASKQTEPWRV